ncbi:Bgt-5337 [Blumeria graminis f. sp. tritici]|uniref:Bgt-5337 n=2 Tax=Blumeria graminis f. sp. tritici TaxID=62690 RepID=A0A061HKK7_BLUGR|nr:hypothetical protein BGT96224_5337 [Blumeria graminis f. sp. tritici 96224]VDB90562.1 Bgt-5337 [Blumeria graminis f. sp. tritici]
MSKPQEPPWQRDIPPFYIVENDDDDQDRHSDETGEANDYFNAHIKPDHNDKNTLVGGYDATPIPTGSDGYTIKFTFHRAQNLPMADLNSRSSDPYVSATLTADLPKRHKNDPDMIMRTPTIHKNMDPEWNFEWIVAGIPSTGFKLKCRLYDEDPNDHDDRLGNVTLHVEKVWKRWPGFSSHSFIVKKRAGSKRAYMMRGCAALLDSDVDLESYLIMSAEILGKSDKPHGRMYTLGLTCYVKHFSPMIGRLAGTKAPKSSEGDSDNKIERYDFQANQFQLQGPVPAQLYHRYVEFKPFVKGMFDKAGLRGRVLNKVLHHQHARVYNYSNSTQYGIVPPCSEAATLHFLKMVHFNQGWRTFTYILTLDGLLRFTETGKEFGIDLLSKHTMHSDVSVYIAYSGEFFVRRRLYRSASTISRDYAHSDARSISSTNPAPGDVSDFQLFIDNDSGTYRPNGDLLPLLETFLLKNFPGLHIQTKRCTDEEHIKMKEDQRERKQTESHDMQMVFLYSDDEISSSDEEHLAKRAGGKAAMGKRERLYAALEDPKKTIKDIIEG